ncbi:cytochrome c oxidase assembly factor Coa1 family protein [Paucibacter sp. XJ19-41]|uniref:cytochrome c oxidase assembly factor Coa1 family protein n=1 Tax=Paucibacter sp. XJ19-41 TaxID=2927824 RepID=UPI00234955B5|nr:cytochrome c oxidase assembly factor Coa1 family protein [Paucibacter sp. XJ19-41]MDC6170494.1 cytochrome c oxidase assembly factor Coa1 family protein [Paucibacter sp. XJ19-41]
MEKNNSGQGAAATVPADLDRWNWGAFLLSWIWGIGNNTFIAFLMFVPLVNFAMIFVLGVKGSAWAWRNKRWDSAEQFRAVQRRWAQWGVIAWLGFAALAVALFFGISAAFKDSDVFKLSLAKLQSSEQVTQMIGTPMSTGMPTGQMQTSGPQGSASLSFAVEGPKGKGTAYVEAVQDLGQWTIKRMVFEQDGTRQRLDLMH